MDSNIKIGVALRTLHLSLWEYGVLKKIQEQNAGRIDFIILVQDETPQVGSRLNYKTILFRLYNFIDRFFFNCSLDTFCTTSIAALFPDAKIFSPNADLRRENGYLDLAGLREAGTCRPDVILFLGETPLPKILLSIPAFGVWSYGFGNPPRGIDAATGFWESVKRAPVFYSCLMVFDPGHPDGRTLCESWALTDQMSPLRNRNNCIWKSVSFASRMLNKLSLDGKSEYDRILHRQNRYAQFFDQAETDTPSNRDMFFIGLRQLAKLSSKAFHKVAFQEQWHLLFAIQDDIATNPSKFRTVIPPRDRFWADPHVLFHDNRFYIFIEEFIYEKGKGHIAVMSIDANGDITSPQKILEKDIHLSYPFVFEQGRKIFMVPDTGAAKTIELYECVEFPYKWRFKMNLMESVDATDSTLWYQNGKWWLFTSLREHPGASHYDELFLFYASELFTADWKPHPQNPIVSDVRKARSAGRLFFRKGVLYRPSQNCSHNYGYGFNLNSIERLSTSEYIEKTVSIVTPKWQRGLLGTHTLSYEKGITVIDAYRYRSKWK